MQTSHQLHALIIAILLHCYPSLPHVLWNFYRVEICNDLHHRLTAQGHLDPTEEDIFDYSPHLIQGLLMVSEISLQQYPQMPLLKQDWDVIVPNPLLNKQLAYNQEPMSNRVEYNYPHFNPEQKLAFDKVINSAKNNKGKIFFLHSAGGCGKTHVSNTIAAAAHANDHIALCAASSSITALLLHGGCTAHYCFKIPSPITESSTCNIKRDENLYDGLKQTKLIIWDEAPMQHHYGTEALDCTLRDLFKTNGQDINQVPLFGGITFMFIHDFRQTLPVVQRGSRVHIINASLHKSRLWRHVHVLHLTQNVHLNCTPESDAFTQWLLTVGTGSPLPDKSIQLPQNMQLPHNSINRLINSIYPGIVLPQAYYPVFQE